MKNRQKIDRFLIQIKYLDTLDLNKYFEDIDFNNEKDLKYFINAFISLDIENTENSSNDFFICFNDLKIKTKTIREIILDLMFDGKIEKIKSKSDVFYNYLLSDENNTAFYNAIVKHKLFENIPDNIIVNLLEIIRKQEIKNKKENIQIYVDALKSFGQDIPRLYSNKILIFFSKFSAKQIFPLYTHLGFEKFEIIIAEKMKNEKALCFLDYDKLLGETFTTRLLSRNANGILNNILNNFEFKKFKIEFYQFLFKNSKTFKHILIDCMNKDLDLKDFSIVYDSVDKIRLHPELEQLMNKMILGFKVNSLPISEEQRQNSKAKI